MPRTALSTVSRTTITIMGTALLAACSSTGEQVFTRQNQAASALATMVMEAEAQNPTQVDKLYAAEAQLHEACAPLRDMASRRMAGEQVGFDSKLVVFASLDRCASETKKVEEFIWLDNPSFARTHFGQPYDGSNGSGAIRQATAGRSSATVQDAVHVSAPK